MIQIYTGGGKGKTTATLGLSLRAVGAGKQVSIVQFLKPARPETSEVKAIAKFLPRIKIKSFGQPIFVKKNKIKNQDLILAQRAWHEAQQEMNGKADIIILDEILVAIYFKLIDEAKVIKCLMHNGKKKEIILTGQKASKKIIKIADLVSEVKPIKHYFDQGIKARKGIEY
ncbi:MAG: cob(I)yrinic acid a,c-diamide adenosyltransferase [Candidatus Portnoybacteria bacterium CG10_big_fil_rev_8_21_14_0_10_36_7]|uniref:Cob(I)yrinic acid a,c-diamide adenosyltransferase n=1 Tax=Candidatus Portnoybacteria bacterium CG10_big_fil_rev_8_21_14_0_10_36_7 TaxID=1974812 RepID=A0A2M8KDY8_9BACT|nr:MAG: cob(I)yrinic acid a,c-diamide adenosyltransferase [Candidatus Portnoybacteria bacterium CG10_big_fil_rev_8_21_14_0_10_36_7]